MISALRAVIASLFGVLLRATDLRAVGLAADFLADCPVGFLVDIVCCVSKRKSLAEARLLIASAV